MPMRVIALALAAAFSSSGCFTYVPISSSEIGPGTRVRASLTDRGTADLARFLGPSVAAVEGTITNRSDEDLVLSVIATDKTNGVEDLWAGEQVAVPRDVIASVELRRFSTLRTVLLVGTMTAGALIINAAAGDLLGIGSGDKDGGGNPTN